MKEHMNFEQAFLVVMDRELGCTIERSKTILKMVNQEIVDYNRTENKLLRRIKLIMDKGIVADKDGGFVSGDGEESFVVYFLNPSGDKGVVPNRFFKKSAIPEQDIRRLLTNWEDITLESCPKCENKVPVVEVHYSDMDVLYKYVVVYCERCDRVFVNSAGFSKND